MAKLEFKNVDFSYGPFEILSNINITVNRGDIVGIMGPSGGGKTTILRLAFGHLTANSGSIHNSFEKPAFVFQDARLLPWKNVLDNVKLALMQFPELQEDEKINKVQDILFKVGLTSKDFEKLPKDLSGGMRQRVNLARALIQKPDLLLLDEPFSALDIGIKRELEGLILKYNQESNISVVFITHDLTEAITLANTIYLISGKPGGITKTFQLEEKPSLRTDQFIYQKTYEFIQDHEIKNVFEIR